MVGPLFSTLSPSEIGRAAFDDATGTLKTSLQAAIVGVQQEVKIDAADDSVVVFQPTGASLHVFVDNFASLSISVTAGSTVTVANTGFTAFQGTNPWVVGGTVTVANPGSSSANRAGTVINQGVTGTAVSFAPPSNSVGFILESVSPNTDNIRWAIGSVAGASVGTLYEPGRDTGFIPCAATISIISPSGTSQEVVIQWIQSS